MGSMGGTQPIEFGAFQFSALKSDICWQQF